ncbi:MAG: hypothetical protein K1X88_09610 [Nannocystaceae bacterium]|nr:hypothetical protein [Nannocystaceae bacterium]
MAATWLVLDRPASMRPQQVIAEPTSARLRASSDEEAPPSRASADVPPPSSSRTSGEYVVRATHEDGESSLTLRWNELAPAERLRVLQDDFEQAVGELEEPRRAEREQVEAQRVAEAALSAMRAELYDSERGRALHQRKEARLERAVETRERGE